MTNQLTRQNITKHFCHNLASAHDGINTNDVVMWVTILLTNPHTAGNIHRTEDFPKMKLLHAGMLKDITVYCICKHVWHSHEKGYSVTCFKSIATYKALHHWTSAIRAGLVCIL